MRSPAKPIGLLVATSSMALVGFGIGAWSGSGSPAHGVLTSPKVFGFGPGGSMRDADRTVVDRRDRVVWAERNPGEETGARVRSAAGGGVGGGGPTGLALRLVPAQGVTLPSGSFVAGAVRFNDLGEVVEILPARSEPCDTLWIEDTGDPETWVVVCLGSCPPDQGACSLRIDFTTLEISCGCP